ncbi:MAG: hypothetical protein ABW199_05045 [Caulobacterales bacterium]
MTANSDINPPAAFIDSHPDFAALIVNAPLSAQFAVHEAKAVRAKRWYTRVGLFSLAAIFVTISVLALSLTLWRETALPDWFVILIGWLGLAGFAAQFVLLFGGLKQRWLLHRFAAERLRSIKFEAFTIAACTGANYATHVEAFSRRKIGDFELQLKSEEGLLREFAPERFLDAPAPVTGTLTPSQLDELKSLYQHMRLDYQARHASSMLAKIREEQRLPASASEMSFWAGAALGFIDAFAALPFFHWIGEGWSEPREFLTLFLFALSAILFVLQRGRSHAAAIQRYDDYSIAVTRTAGALSEARDATEFLACVREGEMLALQELKLFIRESEHATYLL